MLGATLQRRLDAHALANVHSSYFKGDRKWECFALVINFSHNLVIKPSAVEEGQEKVGHPVAK